MLRNVIGKPVRGNDFYDRESEQKRIWADIKNRNNLLILAPRRVGKSSLLYRLQRDATQRGLIGVYVSMADASDEIDFIQRLLKAVSEHSEAKTLADHFRKGPLQKFMDRVKSVSAAGFEFDFRDLAHADWKALATEVATGLLALPSQWLIMIDELPIFLATMLKSDPDADRIRTFMNWFRDLRQGTPESDSITWVLAGSIGLDKFARRWRIVDTVNDLKVFSLGEFSAEVADRFLDDLGRANDLPLEADVREHICRRVGWCIPHSLHILFSSLRDRCLDNDRKPSVAEVDAAFEDAIGPAFRVYFDHWSLRLTDELGAPHDRFARLLLNQIAAASEPITQTQLESLLMPHVSDVDARAETLTWLIDVLEGDGYLVRSGAGFVFRSPLLKEYWKRRFGV